MTPIDTFQNSRDSRHALRQRYKMREVISYCPVLLLLDMYIGTDRDSSSFCCCGSERT